MAKKICMVVGNNFENDSRVLREAISLEKSGFNVTIIALQKEGLPNSENIEGVKVFRLPTSGFSPFADFPNKFFDSYKKLCEQKADVYHCHDLDTLLLGYLAAKKVQGKVIYDSHEFWSARTSFADSFLSRAKIFIREPIFKIMEKFLITKADTVITVNESIAEALEKQYKLKKVWAIYNYHSLKNQKFSNILRDNLGLKDEKVILYLGGINRGRGTLQLVQAMKLLPTNYHLVFLGSGPYKNSVKDLAEKLEIKDRVHLLNPVSPEKVVECASSADVGVCPIQPISKSYFFSSPNKLFECLMAGLPVAVSALPEMSKVVKKYGVGETFDPDNPEEIAEAIKKILENAEYQKMKERALQATKEEYNWEKESQKLGDLYKHLN